MEQIEVQGFGEMTTFAAAEIVFGNTVGAVVLEPEGRGNFSADDEQAFRAAVRRVIADFEDAPNTIIFDPARDNQTSEAV